MSTPWLFQTCLVFVFLCFFGGGVVIVFSFIFSRKYDGGREHLLVMGSISHMTHRKRKWVWNWLHQHIALAHKQCTLHQALVLFREETWLHLPEASWTNYLIFFHIFYFLNLKKTQKHPPPAPNIPQIKGPKNLRDAQIKLFPRFLHKFLQRKTIFVEKCHWNVCLKDPFTNQNVPWIKRKDENCVQ